MTNHIADCAKEIIDSFEKNGYYLYDGRFFSKCYGINVQPIIEAIAIKNNIIEKKIIFSEGFNKTIGFDKVIRTVYFLKKND